MNLDKNSNRLPTWKSQTAKAEFSKLVRQSKVQDQVITNRDKPVAVVVSKKRYDELTAKKNSLLDFFRNAPLPEVEIEVSRSRDFPREIKL